MKVKQIETNGQCEWCNGYCGELYIVTFDSNEESYLLCGSCLNAVKKTLEIVSVKEAEA